MLGSPTLVQVGFIMFAAAMVFQLMSLPIEFDASRRARQELEAMGFVSNDDREGARRLPDPGCLDASGDGVSGEPRSIVTGRRQNLRDFVVIDSRNHRRQ